MEKFIIGLEITKLSNKVGRALEAEIIATVDKNMSATTARIICFVIKENKRRDIYQKDVEHFMGLNRSSVSLTLKNMEKNGFIKRESVKNDARFKKILPTEKAQEYFDPITKAFENVEDRMKIGFSDLDSLQQMLNTIDKNLKE